MSVSEPLVSPHGFGKAHTPRGAQRGAVGAGSQVRATRRWVSRTRLRPIRRVNLPLFRPWTSSQRHSYDTRTHSPGAATLTRSCATSHDAVPSPGGLPLQGVTQGAGPHHQAAEPALIHDPAGAQVRVAACSRRCSPAPAVRVVRVQWRLQKPPPAVFLGACMFGASHAPSSRTKRSGPILQTAKRAPCTHPAWPEWACPCPAALLVVFLSLTFHG